MFDQDIFSCLDSPFHLRFLGEEMTNQHINIITPSSLNIPLASLGSHFSNHESKDDEDHGLTFLQLDFFPPNKPFSDQDHLESEPLSLSQKPDYQAETRSSVMAKNGTTNKLSNNMVDYILKHCLKMMLSQPYRDLITGYCSELKVSYEDVKGYWTRKSGQLLLIHVGINRFEKMMRIKSPFVDIFKYFLTVYLQNDYTVYLAKSSIENKTAYLSCAIKLIYITQVSKKKAYQLIKQTQKGLIH